MSKETIEELLGDDIDPKKKKQLVNWLFKHPEHLETYALLKAKKVAKSMGAKTMDKKELDEGFNKILRRIKRKSILRKSGVAAAIAILMTLSVNLYFENQSFFPNTSDLVHVSTTIGEKKNIILPDGTQVTLNANSQLEYPEIFNDSLREISLNGEAYFKVIRNEHKPLLVNTNSPIKIRVLGTVFNIKSYPEEKHVRTTLVSGKVEVIKQNDNGEVLVLQPSEQATYHKESEQINVETVQSENVISWKQDRLIFDDTPLSQVILDLERKFKVKFKVDSPELLDYKYTGTFSTIALEDVLKLLSISSPINYRLADNIITLTKKENEIK
ncbi:FecR family protein [Flagellimonas pacifica]|uniref:FecR family protein n=1 Tax=Flagellimonas pacifica TaxID=1247520 RepID=A0A285MQB2_9FLAO|nr:FecR domain-containing protein [Allomuricauda parva]SNY99372.1 FecR family protein [Allomuricauda parva]